MALSARTFAAEITVGEKKSIIEWVFLRVFFALLRFGPVGDLRFEEMGLFLAIGHFRLVFANSDEMVFGRQSLFLIFVVNGLRSPVTPRG